MATTGTGTTFEKHSYITGHHVYKFVWTPFIGEELCLEAKDSNQHDKSTVAIITNDEVVGHIPCSFSKVSWHFLKHGGQMNCR